MWQRKKSKKDNLLSRGFRATRPAFVTAIFFSFFINILAFVGPLYMLQIYDRVLASRNLHDAFIFNLDCWIFAGSLCVAGENPVSSFGARRFAI